MPNINLTDSRKRDAVVKAESVRVSDPVRYVGPKGGRCYTRRVLKSTVNHDYETLVEAAGSPEKLGAALVAGDPEVDIETFGSSLWNISRVYTGPDDELVFRIEQYEIVRGPHGKLRERRPRERAEANVDSDVPLKWTGTLLPKAEVYNRYIFASKLQIVHVNGLTFDFLFDMAKELHEAGSLMLLGGGKSGKQPLVFRRGSVPYRGFLEGRIEGERYILLLHLSNMELKPPPEPPKAKAEKPKAEKTESETSKTAKTKAAAPKTAKAKAAAPKTAKAKAAAPKTAKAKAETTKTAKAKTETTKATKAKAAAPKTAKAKAGTPKTTQAKAATAKTSKTKTETTKAKAAAKKPARKAAKTARKTKAKPAKDS